MKLALPMAAAALLLMAGCGGTGEAAQHAGDVSKVDAVTKVVKITEANDPNDLIGRPNGYSAATVYHDERLKCSKPTEVECGAKLEVFDSADAAQKRSDYIQGILEDAPMLGSEYHYLAGSSLLRVSGDLKPSQAKEYEAAFTR